MKLIAGLLWAGTALEASLVSAEALVYTSDASPLPSKESLPSISPNTARLLFAQRLGISQYHSLEGADETTLDVLNTYGGKQQQIFALEERTRSIDRILLIVDGVASPEDIFDHSVRPAVTIQSQPSTSQNRQLALDFLEQDQHSRSKEHNLCQFQFPSSSTLRGGLSSSRMVQTMHILGGDRTMLTRSQESHNCGQWNERMTHDTNGASQKPHLSMYKDLYESLGSGVYGHTTILHVSTLQDLSPNDGERYTTALSDLKTFIKHFHQPNSHVSSTIVIMPANSKPAERSITSPYGTYTKPLTARQQPEEPLSSPSTPPTHEPSAPEVLQASTKPLPRGILPVCHPNPENAIAATNNCSSHGMVYNKSSGAIDCYACKCSKTVLTDDEGRVKTVYWGGPACQKKDISVPFFLLAGLSIALVGAVTWGVGLLMSVGSEELPSVIGAGVAGPRAQK